MRTDIRVHSTAEVSEDAVIGEGSSIWHHTQIRERAKIGRGCILGKGVYVDFDVNIGNNCKLQNGVFVYHPASVGDGVFLGPGVIVTNDRLPRAVNPDLSMKTDDDWSADAVWIGDGASIGAASVILPGVKIGKWAMVGAGAVVTSDIPDHGLAYGNPARLSGYVCRCGQRFDRVRQANGFVCPTCRRQLNLEDSAR